MEYRTSGSTLKLGKLKRFHGQMVKKGHFVKKK